MLASMTDPSSDRPTPPEASLRTMLGVAAWGALTTGGAYRLAGGSMGWFVVWLVGIGLAVRLIAYVVVTRRGETPPPRWWV